MSTFFIFNIIVSCFLAGAMFYVLRLIFQNQKLKEFNVHVADELDLLFRAVREKATVEKSPRGHKGKVNLFQDSTGSIDLEDPGMLSTLITVIVSKHGNMRLKLDDFLAVQNEDYISVYVDTRTSELLLSTDHGIEKQDPLTMVNFTDPDDGTFHQNPSEFMDVPTELHPGDLVKAKKGDRLGIVVEVFGDLNPGNPWVRVRWSSPHNSFEWCKQAGLVPVNKKEADSKEDP